MDELDCAIIDQLQTGFPICDRPYLEAAQKLGISEEELIARIARLLQQGRLTRFGPLFQTEQMGGAFTLAAMRVPDEDYERVANIVNAHPEVAHNYARAHDWNMWFVLATERPEQIEETLARIEETAGYPVLSLPKLKEYFVGFRVTAR